MTVAGNDRSSRRRNKNPGTRLREVRGALGLSLRQAAERAGDISHVAIQKIERMEGTLESVSLRSLSALARAYGLPIETVVAIASGRVDGSSDSALPELAVLLEKVRRYERALEDIRHRLPADLG